MMMLMTTDYLLYAGAESGYSGMTDAVMKLLVYIGLHSSTTGST